MTEESSLLPSVYVCIYMCVCIHVYVTDKSGNLEHFVWVDLDVIEDRHTTYIFIFIRTVVLLILKDNLSAKDATWQANKMKSKIVQ
jgi:hypothetical protein